MRYKTGLLVALLCIMALLASCSPLRGSADPGVNQPAPGTNQPSGEGEEAPAVKVFDKGYVIKKDENRWLITAYVEKDGSASIDAFWFTVNDRTVIRSGSGQEIASDNIAVGSQVEVWHTGEVQESYPAQTVAAKIIADEGPENTPDGMISRTEAVKAALRAQVGSTAALAVKSAALDSENGSWKVELVMHEAPDQPIAVQIDAKTGDIVPVPVAENKVFRVFSPQPGTEAGPGFTVEGEARVFEAAFSWKLEDGHTVLAEGHEMADEGAPEWGRFQFKINYENASQPNMTLILFVYSAKDGSVENELIIPLKAPEENIDYTVK